MERWVSPVVWRCSFFFQAEDGIRDLTVTGVQTCALPILRLDRRRPRAAARLDHVRVQRPLDEVARIAELGRLLLEDADELLADRLALGLRKIGRASCRERV